MRIAMLAPITRRVPPRPYGPEEQLISDLTEGMVERGHQVTLFATANSLTRAELVAVCPKPLIEWDVEPWPDPRWWEDLHVAECMLRAANGDFDIIHNHMHVKALPNLAVLGVPVLTNLHHASRDKQIQPLLLRFKDHAFVSTGDAERNILPALNYVAEIPPPNPEESRAVPRMLDVYEKLLIDLATGKIPTPGSKTRKLSEWGVEKAVDQGEGYLLRSLSVEPGRRLSFEAPRDAAKSWIAVSDGIEIVLNGQARSLLPGESIPIPCGAIHEIDNRKGRPVVILELIRGKDSGQVSTGPYKVEK